MKKLLVFAFFLFITSLMFGQVSNASVFPNLTPNYKKDPYFQVGAKPLPFFSASQYKIYTKINNTLFESVSFFSKQTYNSDCLLTEKVSNRSASYDSVRERLSYDSRKRLSQINGDFYKSGKVNLNYLYQPIYKTTSANIDTVKLYTQNGLLPSSIEAYTYNGDLLLKMETFVMDSFLTMPQFVKGDSIAWTYDSNKRVTSYLIKSVNEDIYLAEERVQLDTILYEKYKYNTEGVIAEREIFKPKSGDKYTKSVFTIIKVGNLITNIQESVTTAERPTPEIVGRNYTYQNQRIISESWYKSAANAPLKTIDYTYNTEGYLISDITTNMNENTGAVISKFRNSYVLDTKGLAKEIKKETQVGSNWEVQSNEILTPSGLCNQVSAISSIPVIPAKIYPNPAHSVVFIQFSENLSGKISLIDMVGRTILSKTFQTAFETDLDINNIESGFYFIDIQTDKGRRVEKIVKGK